MKNQKTQTVNIPVVLHRELKAATAAMGLPVRWAVDAAITEWLSRHVKRAPDLNGALQDVITQAKATAARAEQLTGLLTQFTAEE